MAEKVGSLRLLVFLLGTKRKCQMLSSKLETNFFPKLETTSQRSGFPPVPEDIVRLTEHSAAIPIRDEMIAGLITFGSGS